MNTTNLFVELLIIGLGAFVWIFLNIATIAGLNSNEMREVLSINYALPLIALIYLLGIIFDRIADIIFEYLWADRIKERIAIQGEYHKIRLKLLMNSNEVTKLLEYGRSRMRICRGSTLNIIGIIISLNIYINSSMKFAPIYQTNLILYTNVFLVILTLSCFITWKRLITTEYIRLKEYNDQERNDRSVNVLNEVQSQPIKNESVKETN